MRKNGWSGMSYETFLRLNERAKEELMFFKIPLRINKVFKRFNTVLLNNGAILKIDEVLFRVSFRKLSLSNPSELRGWPGFTTD